MHTFFEAKMDTEQRYAIKYQVRKQGKKLSVKLKKYMSQKLYKKRRYTSGTRDFPEAIIPQLICLEQDVTER